MSNIFARVARRRRLVPETIGGGFRAPMARAVIGGLITSTLLTLVVVPVAYTYFDDFGGWVARGFKRKPNEAAAPVREPVRGGGLTPEPTYGD